MRERYEFQAVLRQAESPGGAYVVFPWDLREEFGAGRVKVHVLFDGIPYDGSIVNMGLKGGPDLLSHRRAEVRPGRPGKDLWGHGPCGGHPAAARSDT